MVKTAFIHRLPGLSFSERCMLFEIAGAGETGNLADPACLNDLLRRTCLSAVELSALHDEVQAEVAWLQGHHGGIVAYPEEGYPPLLREIYDPPFALYFCGTVPFTSSAVAVVGTRSPNSLGARSAYELGASLGRLGIPVISGLARGIDCQAHRGNTAGGAAGTAVLGAGLSEVGPASSRPTADELLAAGGALVSEYPVFSKAKRFHFPMRNRIISGMSRSVVVIQAPVRSGALITVDYALDQGREVFVHGDCMQSVIGDGCRKLADEGAGVVFSGRELLQDWTCIWERPSVQYRAVSL